jgi:hypothetical protein
VTTWTGQAQILADAIREPGYGAAEANARAWRSRCLPEATRGLVAAALVLTDGDAGAALWAGAEPCPDDKTLREWASELEAHIAELLKHCRDMKQACEAELERAAIAHSMASAEASAARGRMDAAGTADAYAGAEHDHELAAGRAHTAALVMADCEAAMEVLGVTAEKLDTALAAVCQVPADMGETYETPYSYVRNEGPLPHHGDFLTGATT